MQAVLTYLDGHAREVAVADPPPGRFYESILFPPDFAIGNGNSFDLQPVQKQTQRVFILAGCEFGVAEYFEEGLPDEKLFLYRQELSFMKNKADMVKVVQQFRQDHPDLSMYEDEIAKLGSEMKPYPHESPYQFLERVYKQYKKNLQQKQVQIDTYLKMQQGLQQQSQIDTYLKKQQQYNDASQQLEELKSHFGQPQLNKWAQQQAFPANQTNVTWTSTYQPQGGLMQPAGAEWYGDPIEQSKPAVIAKPKKEIPSPEKPKGRMIVIKKTP